jgi:hypothetical protein
VNRPSIMMSDTIVYLETSLQEHDIVYSHGKPEPSIGIKYFMFWTLLMGIMCKVMAHREYYPLLVC